MLAVVTAAFVTRGATKFSARLAALQRVRDAELVVLNEFGEALIGAYIAVQSYTLAVPADVRTKTEFTVEEWHRDRPLIEPSLVAVQRAEYLAAALPWPDLVASHKNAHDLLMSTVAQSTDGKDTWSEALDEEPNVLMKAMHDVADKRRDLLSTYPVDAPKAGLSARLLGKRTVLTRTSTVH